MGRRATACVDDRASEDDRRQVEVDVDFFSEGLGEGGGSFVSTLRSSGEAWQETSQMERAKSFGIGVSQLTG